MNAKTSELFIFSGPNSVERRSVFERSELSMRSFLSRKRFYFRQIVVEKDSCTYPVTEKERI